MRWILPVLLAMALLASCSPVVPIPVDSPGSKGRSRSARSAQWNKLVSPGPDRPYQAILTVRAPDGRRVARFSTDAQGRFRIALSPGNYILHPESPGGMPHAADLQFTVLPGRFTPLAISYDSGIR